MLEAATSDLLEVDAAKIAQQKSNTYEKQSASLDQPALPRIEDFSKQSKRSKNSPAPSSPASSKTHLPIIERTKS